jgi:hypothetical protein
LSGKKNQRYRNHRKLPGINFYEGQAWRPGIRRETGSVESGTVIAQSPEIYDGSREGEKKFLKKSRTR